MTMNLIEFNIWEAALTLVGGFLLLGWSSERFVDESVGLAQRLSTSPFLIGIIIVGFGTSLPELTVSALSALDAHADLSLGNAYGSCSYNIAVILGLLALIHPLRIKPHVRRGILPVLLAVTLISAAILALCHGVPRLGGIFLLVLFVLYVLALLRRNARNVIPATTAQNGCDGHLLPLAVSLAVLLGSSALVVWSAEAIARQLGVPELVIGLTVVAAGTSLPELATSIVALRRRQTDLILGNILGSNLFNLLAVVGMSATLHPLDHASPAILWRDLPFLFAVTALLFTRRLTRCRGAVLLLGFLVYALLAWF